MKKSIIVLSALTAFSVAEASGKATLDLRSVVDGLDYRIVAVTTIDCYYCWLSESANLVGRVYLYKPGQSTPSETIDIDEPIDASRKSYNDKTYDIYSFDPFAGYSKAVVDLKIVQFDTIKITAKRTFNQEFPRMRGRSCQAAWRRSE